jgi:hypothetical protein
VSLAARPSNIGTRFHNFLYDELGLDFVYKAFAPVDLEAAVAGIRGLGIRGAGVSMPFKEACIPLLDELDPSAAAIDSADGCAATTPTTSRLQRRCPHDVSGLTDRSASNERGRSTPDRPACGRRLPRQRRG